MTRIQDKIFQIRNLLVCIVCHAIYVTAANDIKAKIVDLLWKGDNQEVLKFPPHYDLDGGKTDIFCDMYVTSFDDVNEADMDFTISLLLHLEWTDMRLQKDLQSLDFEEVELDSKSVGSLWTPDVFFPNEKEASYHNIMSPNRMFRLTKKCILNYTVRLTLKLSCVMRLHSYPFDKQTCRLHLESFGYDAQQINLHWSKENQPIGMNITSLPQFEVVGHAYDNFFSDHRIRGNYSTLSAQFDFRRNIGYYVVQMYIPTLLIVMLSWVSFWLNVNSVPGRVTLGVLSVLTISTQSSSVNASLPRVSYTKAIDIWMATCLVFVFAALIEFAIANVLTRKGSHKGIIMKKLIKLAKEVREKALMRNNQGVMASSDPDGLRHRGSVSSDETNGNKKETVVKMDAGVTLQKQRSELEDKPAFEKGMLYAMYCDVASRILFPLVFAIFNVVYWVHYIQILNY
ncbi:glycine receptor subunit alphaZ1-like [Mytilus galloprovincialis]|uniref:Uncharacterized protein n=1 Tax=Mytilus galloprovincialis TaxID=29158 RepID=A0A8B6GGY1_MYTGA|nr:Hypothetical predicted protein [Mytilus galloprovincialis]